MYHFLLCDSAPSSPAMSSPSAWAKQKPTVTCRKEKDEGPTEPGCENTSRQEVLLEATSLEHLDPS